MTSPGTDPETMTATELTSLIEHASQDASDAGDQIRAAACDRDLMTAQVSPDDAAGRFALAFIELRARGVPGPWQAAP
jgi:hypothetical protein